MSRLTKKFNGEYYRKEANTIMFNSEVDYNAIQKLGKLEDIEEELGCPLEVVFKGLKEGITFEHRGANLRSDDIRLFYFNHKWIMRVYAFIQGYGSNAYDLELNNYGKTWWIKGEKDE